MYIKNRLEIKVVSKNNTNIIIRNTIFRTRFSYSRNIIEEIGRINGYDKIPSQLPCSFLSPAERNNELFLINKIRDIFKELNYSEVYNYSFVSEKEVKGLKAEPINNPVRSFFKYLRPSLIPQITNNINENLKFFNQVKIFEIGKVFVPEDKKYKRK
jgi:phenylalanyl-tRNA synthetase beta chain